MAMSSFPLEKAAAQKHDSPFTQCGLTIVESIRLEQTFNIIRSNPQASSTPMLTPRAHPQVCAPMPGGMREADLLILQVLMLRSFTADDCMEELGRGRKSLLLYQQSVRQNHCSAHFWIPVAFQTCRWAANLPPVPAKLNCSSLRAPVSSSWEAQCS